MTTYLTKKQATANTTKALCTAYNRLAADLSKKVLKKFSTKPDAIKRYLAIAVEHKSANPVTEPAPAAPAPVLTEPAPAEPAPAAPAPVAVVKPTKKVRGIITIAPKTAANVALVREDTKQHKILRALHTGVTITRLCEITNWSSTTVRSALYGDVNSVKGYGVRTEAHGDAENTYHIVYPDGIDHIILK